MSTILQQRSNDFYLAPLSVFAAILAVLLILLLLPFLVNRLRRCPAIGVFLDKITYWICPSLYVPPSTTDMRPMSSQGLKTLKITQFEHHKVKHGDLEDAAESEVCAICLSEFVKEQLIVTLPCDHYFHKECLLSWLKRDASCPMCKAVLEPKPQQQHAVEITSSTSAAAAATAAPSAAAASLPATPQSAVTPDRATVAAGGSATAAVAYAPTTLHVIVG